MPGVLSHIGNDAFLRVIARWLAVSLLINLFAIAGAVNSRAAQVAVFLIARPADGIAKSLRKQTEAAAPKAIAQLKSLSTSSITSNEREHTVVFYASRKLPIGTRIKIEHQFTRPGMGKLAPYVMTYQINAANQSTPFVILNKSKAGGSGGTITYRIYLNGKLSGSSTVRIR